MTKAKAKNKETWKVIAWAPSGKRISACMCRANSNTCGGIAVQSSPSAKLRIMIQHYDA